MDLYSLEWDREHLGLTLGKITTSIALTYMFWEVAKRPASQAELRRELRSHIPGIDSNMPVFADVVNPPLLDAVVQEALRLHPAAPASPPRETPRSGRVLKEFHVPQGVSASELM